MFVVAYKMKNTILLLLLFVSLHSSSQKVPKASVDLKQLVRTEVIKQTKGLCALPKYYKTEKVDVYLISKPRPYTYDAGVSKVSYSDTIGKAKYIIFKYTDDDVYADFFYKKGIVSQTMYRVDSIYYKVSENGIYFETSFFDIDSINKSFNYYTYRDSTTFDDKIEYFKLYAKKKTIKDVTDAKYLTEIYYWAMSKGGTVRLYHDIGYAYVDKNGKVIYILESSE